MRALIFVAMLSPAVVIACSDPAPPHVDAAIDAAIVDAAIDARDAAVPDAVELDAGPDAIEIDAAPDAGVDAAPDAPIDAAPDAMPPNLPTVPVLRAPSRHAYVGSSFAPGSLRPRFVWEASTTPTPATITYEHELGTDASFLAGVTVTTTAATSHTPAADLPVSQAVPVGTRYYWRVRACVAAVGCSAYSAIWWVNVGRSERDFNGDGFADVVVGAPTNDAGGPDAGRAYVYFGGAGATFDTTADGTLTGAAVSDYYGATVAAVGDVNGDGFGDVVIAAIYNDTGGSQAGRAYVYFGGAGATFDTTADGTLASAGAGDTFGSAVASAGDVNGDGFTDVIVGAPSNDAAGSDAGRAYVYLGASGASFDAVADGTLTGAVAGDRLGTSVATAGDVNGDGFADLIVGARLANANLGRAYVYLGGAGASVDATADGTLTGAAAFDYFGNAVASAGDANGDGFADVLVGAYGNDAGGLDAGRVDLYLGGAGASFDAGSDRTLTGAAGDSFGRALAVAGDVNGDGFADVVIGAVYDDAGGSDAGRAYVYFGGGALEPTADGTFTGGAANDLLGADVAAAGDVNGDGFADVIVGAPGADPGALGAGAAYVYFGGAGLAVDPIADGALAGAAADNRFGTSVASVEVPRLFGEGNAACHRACWPAIASSGKVARCRSPHRSRLPWKGRSSAA